METASTQIRGLYAKANARERQDIHEQLRDLQRELYSDWEVFFDLVLGPYKLAITQIGFDLDIFTTLSSSSTSITHQELVQKTKAAPNMLSHLLHTMAAFGLIAETHNSAFSANRLTRLLARPDVIGAAPHLFDLHAPIAQVLPSYLRAHNYQPLTDPTDLPFQQAVKTHLRPFEWLKQNSTQMKALGHVMVLDAVASWVVSYPVDRVLGSFTPPSLDSALLVDIGGGFGQHALAFKNKFPHLPGRIVVQDLPSTLAHAPAIPGIEFQEHDFFTSQPVKGAAFYYLRHIVHDWMDEDCVSILRNVGEAMGPHSRVLIDEVVLPEGRWPWQVALSDVAMMACLGGIERSEGDWEVLLDKAGLEVVGCHVYDEWRFHGVVTAVVKGQGQQGEGGGGE